MGMGWVVRNLIIPPAIHISGLLRPPERFWRFNLYLVRGLSTTGQENFKNNKDNTTTFPSFLLPSRSLEHNQFCQAFQGA